MSACKTTARKAKPKPFRPLEKHVERAIMAALKLQGCFVQKIRQGAFKPKTGRRRFVRLGCEPGTPDLLVTFGSRAFRIEVKRDEHEHLSDVQAEWHAAAKARGEIVFVCWSVPMAIDALRTAKATWQGESARGAA